MVKSKMDGGMLTMAKKSFCNAVKILLLIVVSTMIIMYLFFFSSLGLPVYDGEKIIFADQYLARTAIVTQEGRVYINGTQDDARSKVLGIDNVHRYKNLYNSGRETSLVCIYNKNDAAKVCLSLKGGAIITKNSELYIFSSLSSKYETPQFFAQNVKNAIAYENKIYILTTNGIFGFYYLSDQMHFTPLLYSVAYFDVLEESKELILISAKGELYIMKCGTEPIKYSQCFLKNIESISAVQFYVETTPAISVCVVNKEGELVLYSLLGSFDVQKALHQTPKRLAQNIKNAAAYEYGVAAIDQADNLLVYGKDFSFNNIVLDGDVICENCILISSSAESIVAIKDDGLIEKYGYMLDQTYRPFVNGTEK